MVVENQPFQENFTAGAGWPSVLMGIFAQSFRYESPCRLIADFRFEIYRRRVHFEMKDRSLFDMRGLPFLPIWLMCVISIWKMISHFERISGFISDLSGHTPVFSIWWFFRLISDFLFRLMIGETSFRNDVVLSFWNNGMTLSSR